MESLKLEQGSDIEFHTILKTIKDKLLEIDNVEQLVMFHEFLDYLDVFDKTERKNRNHLASKLFKKISERIFQNTEITSQLNSQTQYEEIQKDDEKIKNISKSNKSIQTDVISIYLRDELLKLQNCHEKLVEFCKEKLENINKLCEMQRENFHLFLHAEKTQKVLRADKEYQHTLEKLSRNLENLILSKRLTWELQ